MIWQNITKFNDNFYVKGFSPAVSNIEAALHKAAAVWPPTTYYKNYLN